MKGVTMQSRAPDIPAKRPPDVIKSVRLNAERQADLEYLVDVWFDEDPRITANGAACRAIQEAAARERGRRRA